MRLASDRKRKLEDWQQNNDIIGDAASSSGSISQPVTPPTDEPIIAPIHINPAYLPVDAYHGVPPRSMIL